MKASSLKALNAIPRERLCYAEHMRAGEPSRTWKHSWHTNKSNKVGRPRWELNLGPRIASQRHSRMATPALSKINIHSIQHTRKHCIRETHCQNVIYFGFVENFLESRVK